MMENQLYKILSSKFFSYPRKLLSRFLISYLDFKHNELASPKQVNKTVNRVFALRKRIRQERKIATVTTIRKHTGMVIRFAVISTEHIPGDIAEVGVYQGSTAKIICEAKNDRHLHLFDTFEGLPPLSEWDDHVRFYETRFAYPLEKVQQRLAIYKNVHFYKGIAPLSAKPVEGKHFSFVHLDADLYRSTLECLEFFYPRLSKQGVLISHDYNSSPGVKKAFDEFFKDKPDFLLELPTNQCLIVKME